MINIRNFALSVIILLYGSIAASAAERIMVKLRPAGLGSMTGLSSNTLSAVSSLKPAFDPANKTLAKSLGLDRWFIAEGKGNTNLQKLLITDSAVERTDTIGQTHLVMTPNDPQFPDQWGLNNTGQSGGTPGADIRALPAWDITTGTSGITIAIIDTGIDNTQPDLTGQIVAGYNFVSNNTNTNDDQGHGTACAGIVGGLGNNGILTAGVCWGCKLMPVKIVGSSGYGEDYWLAQGILWAVDHGANVLSMSLVTDTDVTYVRSAVDYAIASNVTVVAAVGNDSQAAIRYPAAIPEVIAVGAMDRWNNKATFSNTGAEIDVVAPGVSVLTLKRGQGVQNPEIRQTVAAVPGHQYELSTWVYTQGSPSTCSAFLQWFDGPNPPTYGQCTTIASTTTNTTGWTQLTGTVTPTASQLTICLRLSWNCSAIGGGGNFDMASLRDLTAGSGNLLTNPSFEDNAGSTTGWTGNLTSINNTIPNPTSAKDGAKWVGSSCVDSGTQNFAGTSAATPHVAAVCGLALSVNDTITPSQMQSIIQQSAYDLGAPGFDTNFGYGRVNANQVLTQARDLLPWTNPVVADSGTYTDDPAQLSFTWSPAGHPSGILGYEYAVGTLADPTILRNWTWMGSVTSFTATGLSLAANQSYIISVRAQNGDLGYSTPGVSDGITYAPLVPNIGQTRLLAPGNYLTLNGPIVSAVFFERTWIEEADRSASLALSGSSGVFEGHIVKVSGRLEVSGNYRILADPRLWVIGQVSVPSPYSMAQRYLGGAPLNGQTPGVTNGVGLYNIGQLVTVYGKVTTVVAPTLTMPGYVFADDGSALQGFNNEPGVKILTDSWPQPSPQWFISATGIVEIESFSGATKPIIHIRNANDIVRLN